METYSLILMAAWLVPLWLLGWLALPVSRMLFSKMHDGGLAAGRLLALVFISLIAFWAASVHLFSLKWSPLLWTIPISAAAFAIIRSFRCHEYSAGWKAFFNLKWRALFYSDLIFLCAFLFFAALRLCNPSINEFEKPMDSAIIGSLSRSEFLPAENPWFAGMDFTNYYYFGHFMASILKRTFNTPLPYAYNLIQPAFCAFFLSSLWALCVTLCRSSLRGTLAFYIVGLCGNFEPLRQWLFPSPSLNRSTFFPFLDWWSTSRVVPNTINEYPFFTLALGDAHAHFFALGLTVLLLSSCCNLAASFETRRPIRRFPLLLFILSTELSAILMTNAWDFPVYSILAVLTIGFALAASRTNPNQCLKTTVNILCLSLSPILATLLLALPFLLRFKPQTHGITIELWPPQTTPLLLLWGGFLTLWLIFLARQKQDCKPVCNDGNITGAQHLVAQGLIFWPVAFIASFWIVFIFPNALLILLLLLLIASIIKLYAKFTSACKNKRHDFILLLMGCLGLIVLLLPHFAHLRGYFSGDLRHQDTVFKFGQQAWLLFGTAATCSALELIKSRFRSTLALLLFLFIWTIPFLCSVSIVQSRTNAPLSTPAHNRELSLNSALFLQDYDQYTVKWLEANAPANAFLMESVGRDANGNFVGAYGAFALTSSLTGIPAYIGWPQHAGFWGAPHQEIEARLIDSEDFFNNWPNSKAPLLTRAPNHERLSIIYFGPTERSITNPFNQPRNQLARSAPRFDQIFHLHTSVVFASKIEN